VLLQKAKDHGPEAARARVLVRGTGGGLLRDGRRAGGAGAIVKDYPNSADAVEAKKLLKEIGSK